MVIRLAPDARSVVKAAETEARARRAPLVQAEHMLLAVSAQSDSDAARVLASVGLTHGAIEEALDREFEASLVAAGMSVSTRSLGRPSVREPRRLRLSSSFKAAMGRAVRAVAGAGQIRSAHLLLGVLGAEGGTVPRALHLAGVNRAELMTATHQLLDS
jgi:ATP-dependent Clp protease ATP-binding subunit ClpA